MNRANGAPDNPKGSSEAPNPFRILEVHLKAINSEGEVCRKVGSCPKRIKNKMSVRCEECEYEYMSKRERKRCSEQSKHVLSVVKCEALPAATQGAFVCICAKCPMPIYRSLA